MARNWGADYVSFLKDQEGFRSDPYKDATGNWTVGYGHKIREGEDFSSGISEEQADRLLRQDMQSHYRRARARFGEEDFDSLDERRRLMLMDMDFNAGLHKFPKFTEAVRENNLEGMLAEYERSAGGKKLTKRNQGFYDMFLADYDGGGAPEVVVDDTPARSVTVQQPRQRETIKTYADSAEFLSLPEDRRVEELAKRDERFAAIASTNPAKAKEMADRIHAFNAGGGYGVWDSLSGGFEAGLGQATLVAAGALSMIEDAGLMETPDEDVLDWAHMRIKDGQTRVGTGWEAQAAHLVGNVAGAIVPGALLSGAAYMGGAALMAGTPGIGLLMGSQALGMGAAGAMAGYTESPQAALQRGAIDAALGAAGGGTAVLGRLARFPADAALGLVAGELQGLESRENLIQALAMATISGMPGKYISPKRAKDLGITPDSYPGAAGMLAESEKLARLRKQVEDFDAPLETPVTGPDGQELRTVGEFLRAVGDDIENTSPIYWRSQDMTPEQQLAWQNREDLALQDGRTIEVGGTSRDDLYRYARELGVPDAEEFVDDLYRVRVAEKDEADVALDPVTGRELNADELGDLLEAAGQDRTGAEFSRRRYTEAEIADFDRVTNRITEMANDPKIKGQMDDFADLDRMLDDHINGRGEPSAELPSGWNPGWRHTPMKPAGANPDRVTAGTDIQIKKPGEIIKRFAKKWGFNVRRGEVRGGEGAAGWHWGKTREMKQLDPGNVQVTAHEWGHDLVRTRPELAQYAVGEKLAREVNELRLWLLEKEMAAGAEYFEAGVPVKTLLKYADELPDRFKRLEEQMALSYDRPDLHEGWAEFIRIYSTNNKKFGGDVDLDGRHGGNGQGEREAYAPELNKIWEDFIENGMSKSERDAYMEFVKDAHEYVQADAITSAQARIGGDENTESILQSAISRYRQGAIDSNEGAWNAVAKALSPEEADRVIAYFQAAQNANRLLDLSAQRGVPLLQFDDMGRPHQVANPNGRSLAKILSMIGDTPKMQRAFAQFAPGPRAKELYGQAIRGNKIQSVKQVTEDYIDQLAKQRAKTKDPKEAAQIDNILRRWHSGENRPKLEDQILSMAGWSRRENLFSLEEINGMLRIADDPQFKHFRKAYDELRLWQRDVREYGRRAGLFSQRQVVGWEQWNSEYAFPFQRDMSDVIGGAAGGDSVLRGKVVRQLRGDRRNLAGNWLELTLGGADTIFRRAEENIAKTQLVDTILRTPNAGIWFDTYEPYVKSRAHPSEPFERRVGRIADPKDRDRTIVVRREGKEYYYTPKDQGMLDSVKFLRRPALPGWAQAIGKVRTGIQDTITLNPEFFTSALERDLVGGFLFSKTGGSIVRKAINGISHSMRNSPEYQNYMANVGGSAQLTGINPATANNLLRDARRTTSNVKDILTSPLKVLDLMRKITNSIESGVRFGEYQQAIKQGIPAKHAAWLGTQIQPNFSARGTWQMMRGIQEVTPFLSATMNSADRFARAGFRDAEGRGAFMARLGGAAVAAITLTEINRRMDPDWGKHPEWLKRAYHIVPLPQMEGGQLKTDDRGHLVLDRYLIAKNHEIGLIANVAERIMDEMYDSTADGVADAATDVAMIMLSNVGINAGAEQMPLPAPVGIGLGLELKYNVNNFTGNPIEAMETIGRSAHNRATSKTPEVYRQWGEWMGQVPFAPDWLSSPQKAEHIVRYFTNSFGVQGALLAEQFLNPDGPDMHWEDAPIVRRHRLRDEKYDRAVGEFWDINKRLSEVKEDMDYFMNSGDLEGLRRMKEDPQFRAKIGMQKAFQRARAVVSDLTNQQELIREHRDMSGAEKLRRIDAIEMRKRQIQRRMFEKYREKIDE